MKMQIKKFKKVKSTNDIAINLIKKSISKPTLIITESQTNGRGRIGKKWISKKGNLFLYFSNLIQKKLILNSSQF